MDLYRSIYQRKSTRKYREQPPDGGILKTIAGQTAALTPLHAEIRTEFRILGRSEMPAHFKNASVTAPYYLVITSEDKPGFDENAGFMGEQAVLFLTSLGLGTCWLGTLKPKPESFTLPYVIAVAFGFAEESPFRESTEGILRKPLDGICLNRAPDAFTQEAAEMVRIAPSALNRQPWRLDPGPERIRLYCEQPGFLAPINSLTVKGLIPGAVLKGFHGIDCGIALEHIAVCAAHAGREIEFKKEPCLANSHPKLTYMMTAALKPR